MKNYLSVFSLTALLLCSLISFGQHQKKYELIAHRGGVVDSTREENSLEALRAARQHGYYMIEIDVRLTADSVLVTHHDATLTRTFGIDTPLSKQTWKELSTLKNKNGYRILLLEEALKEASGSLQIMVDLKIRGNHPRIFHQLLDLLRKYNLHKQAMMIGTDESTEFFTGKIKLSCTRQQLEENMQKKHFNPAHYYLFSGNISAADVAWAKQHNILAVGVVNAWSFKADNGMDMARAQAQRLIDAGVRYFQIDSIYEPFFQ